MFRSSFSYVCTQEVMKSLKMDINMLTVVEAIFFICCWLETLNFARVETTEESIILAQINQIRNQTLENHNILIKIQKDIRYLKRASKNKGSSKKGRQKKCNSTDTHPCGGKVLKTTANATFVDFGPTAEYPWNTSFCNSTIATEPSRRELLDLRDCFNNGVVIWSSTNQKKRLLNLDLCRKVNKTFTDFRVGHQIRKDGTICKQLITQKFKKTPRLVVKYFRTSDY